jgi:hypothetical protein
VTGKSSRSFLVDDEPTCVLRAEICGWTGKVPVVPRSQLARLSKREEARRTGVNLLVGPDQGDPWRELADIDEEENVLKRLRLRATAAASAVRCAR